MSRDYRVVPFILFSLYLLFVALVIGLDLRAPAFFGEFGLTDLKVYWAATQVLLDGNNPYQAEHIGAKLAQIGAGPAQVLRFAR